MSTVLNCPFCISYKQNSVQSNLATGRIAAGQPVDEEVWTSTTAQSRALRY